MFSSLPYLISFVNNKNKKKFGNLFFSLTILIQINFAFFSYLNVLTDNAFIIEKAF